MRLKIIFVFLGIALSTAFISFSYEQDNSWRLKKQSNAITVYTRNSERSAFKELRAVTQIKTSLSSVVALLNDWESYPQWVYKCSISKTLKRISETELIHYQTIMTPWPTDNRDFVVYVKLSQDIKTKTITQNTISIPEYIPAVTGFVRVPELKASWVISPLKNGLVNIEYQLHVNPGGNIPPSIENFAAIDGPYQTMLNMKQWVIKEKYQNAKLAFIAEPEIE